MLGLLIDWIGVVAVRLPCGARRRDPPDRGVCAGGAYAGCDLLVSFNLKQNPCVFAHLRDPEPAIGAEKSFSGTPGRKPTRSPHEVRGVVCASVGWKCKRGV